ncbi:MAG: DUF1947 domain-containing protein [Candidatus Aenigmarchaeota archaeon]|nr:DUF1947 domain-containing protein [Candidatus Aenigmarchaeota archaeon]
MKRHHLSKKEIKELNNQHPLAGLSKKDTIEIVESDEKVILVNEKPWFFYLGDKIYPTIKQVLERGVENFPAVFVDKGAIPFVIKGADVMRPGIVTIDDTVKKDSYVVVADQEHKKSLAIGIALFDAEEMKNLKTGKVIKSIHRIGDAVWGF